MHCSNPLIFLYCYVQELRAKMHSQTFSPTVLTALITVLLTPTQISLVIHSLHGSCYWRNCVPSDSYVKVLTLSTSACDLIWRVGLYRGSQLKERSLGWHWSNMTGVFIQRGLDIQMESEMKRCREKMATFKAKRDLERTSLCSPQKDLTQTTPTVVFTSSLENREKISI